MPDERSRALLWAGGLLIRLNSDRRVPIELRRIATSIARHFPAVEDVEHAATLSLLRDHGGMFEHPRNCPNWQEKCPGPPLTHRTRLNWPSEDADDGIDQAKAESSDSEVDSNAESLKEQIASMSRAQEDLKRHEHSLYALCVDDMPTLLVCFAALEWTTEQAVEWVLRRQFDGDTKHVGHLLLEDRRCDIIDRLRQLTHENPGKGRPLDSEE